MPEAPTVTTPDDLLEAQVIMHEESLEASTRGSGEGKRYPVTVNIDGKIVEIVDQPEEVKFATATEAVNKRAEKYAEETFRVAKFKLENMTAVEAVDHIAPLSPGDKEIYLRAEKAGKGRKEIFEVFGNPEE